MRQRTAPAQRAGPTPRVSRHAVELTGVLDWDLTASNPNLSAR
jgi:hypothetical protein